MTFLHQIDPILFQSPEFSLFGANFQPAVHWYGLMYLLGFSAAWLLAAAASRAVSPAGRTNSLQRSVVLTACSGDLRRAHRLHPDLRPGSYIADPCRSSRSGRRHEFPRRSASCWWRRLCGRANSACTFSTSSISSRRWLPPGLGLGRLGNFINGELGASYNRSRLGRDLPRAPSRAVIGLCAAQSERSMPAALRCDCAASVAAVTSSRWKA